MDSVLYYCVPMNRRAFTLRPSVIVVESEVVDMNDKTVENLLNCSIIHKIGFMYRTDPELHQSS